MKYTISLNLQKSFEWELTSSESIVFAWIYELASWADKMEYKGNIYYFGSRNKACEELPSITDKRDTMYRIYKSLQNKGLINLIMLESSDYLSLTEKGKEWYNDNSEKNPSNGNKYKETEKNPTYKYTSKESNINKEIEYKYSIKKNNKFSFKQALLDLGVEQQIVDDWLLVRKGKKATNTETAFNSIKKQIELSNADANDCIRVSVERSWSGFKAEWYNNIKKEENINVKQQPKKVEWQ